MDGSVPTYPPQLTIHYWAFITLFGKSPPFPSHCHFDSLVLTSFTTLFIAAPHSLWDLSFPTRDGMCVPYSESAVS